MRALFLTSYLGGYTKTIKGNEFVDEIIKCNNSNHFIDRLKCYSHNLTNFVCIASNPDNGEKTDKYSSIIVKALNLDNFEIKNVSIIDHRFQGDIKKTIFSADCVFLMGGNVPTQNRYFKEIGLKEILKTYNGIIIGQSAESMNCSKIVYTQPEEDEEFEDNNYQRQISGLDLIDFAIMPHMNKANEIEEQSHPTVMQMCLEDSYKIPHYGIVDYGFIEVSKDSIIAYGETYFIKNGKCTKICDDGNSCNLNNFITSTNLNYDK